LLLVVEVAVQILEAQVVLVVYLGKAGVQFLRAVIA
jgi:hypothetical protein